jgi:hypothetical protein
LATLMMPPTCPRRRQMISMYRAILKNAITQLWTLALLCYSNSSKSKPGGCNPPVLQEA